METFILFITSFKGKVLLVGLLIILAIYFAIKSQIKKQKVVLFEKEGVKKEKEKKGL